MSNFRTLSLWLLTTLVSVGLLLVSAEALVRLLVPEEAFPLSKVYRPSDIAGIGYTFRPNLAHTAFGQRLHTNSLGFRGPEWQRDKPQGTFRIALIGDSHAFGHSVAYPDTVGEVLAELLNRRGHTLYETLNFAVPGYNTHQELAVLRALALDYEPDLVIILVSSNDHQPALIPDAEGWLHWHRRISRKTRLADPVIGKAKQKVPSWVAQHSRLWLYLVMLKIGHDIAKAQAPASVPKRSDTSGESWMGPFPPGPVSDRLRGDVYQPLVEMVRQVREAGSTPVIAAFAEFLDYRQMLAQIAREQKVPVLELLSLFPEVSSWEDLVEQFGGGVDSHLNGVAHRRWAEGLAELLERHELLPSSEPQVRRVPAPPQ
jgi:lysophospholipase L1-like esterase